MSIKRRISQISRREANTAFRDYFAIQTGKSNQCSNTARVTDLSNFSSTGKVEVTLKDGTVKEVYITGNRPISEGAYVPINGDFIL